MKKRKTKQRNKPSKKTPLKTKIIRIIAIVFILSIILAVIFKEPLIAFFTFGFLFLLSFSISGFILLHQKVKFIKNTNAFLDTLMRSNETSNTAPNQQFYSNPMYYHIFLILLALLNVVFSELQSETYNNALYSHFYEDLSFQITIALLFSIIGFLNPFLKIPLPLQHAIKKRYKKLYGFISNENKFFIFRVLACISVILIFIYKGWLVFPNLFQDDLISKGIDITLLFFVLSSIIEMIRYAKQFLFTNVFRIIKSFTIFTSSLFVLVPLVPITILTLHLLDIDENTFNFLPIPFIGFNIIMVYVEYSLNIKNIEPEIVSQ